MALLQVRIFCGVFLFENSEYKNSADSTIPIITVVICIPFPLKKSGINLEEISWNSFGNGIFHYKDILKLYFRDVLS